LTLAGQGIDKNLAKRARPLASITEASFEKRMTGAKERLKTVPENMAEVRRDFGAAKFENPLSRRCWVASGQQSAKACSVAGIGFQTSRSTMSGWSPETLDQGEEPRASSVRVCEEGLCVTTKPLL